MNRRDFIKNAALAGIVLPGSFHLMRGNALAQSTILIGFSQALMNHPHRVAMARVNEKYCADNFKDAKFVMTDANDQATKQVADVESLIAQGINVLMISPVTAQALTPVIKDAMAQGIPVVTMDRKVNTEVTCHIGADNMLIGTNAGDYVKKRFGADAKIIEVQGTRWRLADDRPFRRFPQRSGCRCRQTDHRHPDLRLSPREFPEIRRGLHQSLRSRRVQCRLCP